MPAYKQLINAARSRNNADEGKNTWCAHQLETLGLSLSKTDEHSEVNQASAQLVGEQGSREAAPRQKQISNTASTSHERWELRD